MPNPKLPLPTMNPCPGCGGEHHFLGTGLRKDFNRGTPARPFYFVFCMGCPTKGNYRSTRKLAIKAWNQKKVNYI